MARSFHTPLFMASVAYILCCRYFSNVGGHLTGNFTLLYLNSRCLNICHGLEGGAWAAVNLPVPLMYSASSLWMVSLDSGMLAPSSIPSRPCISR